MLSNQELENWCNQLNLSTSARILTNKIRASEPVRRVGGYGSVCGRYPSLKMGKVIQFESHKVELPAIEEYEADEDVLEYYDQPIQLKLSFASSNGRTITCKHVPDFFVIRRTAVGFEEWKQELRLQELAQQQPTHYCHSENGQWHNLPAEAYSCQCGIYYRLRLDREINWIRYRNSQFLRSYRDGSYLVAKDVLSMLLAEIAATPGITLAQLLESTPSANADDINALIATGHIYIDQDAALLSEPTKVQLFRDLETAQACRLIEPWRTTGMLRGSDLEEGKSLYWDGKPVSVIQKGDTLVVLRGEGGLIQLTHNEFNHLLQQQQITSAENKQIFIHKQAWELFQKASPEDLKIANYRYRVIEPYLQGELPELEVVPERTIRRWKHWFKTAVQIYNWGYIGLLPHRTAKGNRSARISADAWEFIDKIVEEHYETLKQKGKLAVYGILVKEWEKHERIDCCPSHVTFYNRLKQRAGYEQTKKRQGTRVAYQKSPFYWELELSTPRHGERPWEICHIDHTELDIELVCSGTGRLLGRPWATIVIDAYSRRVLAVYLSFDCPSYRSCMMVLRTCVQRFERFPETLVVDHGAEFDSVYFETLLAAFKCTKKQRPVARPRFGSIMERFFGTTNTEFFYTLKGNTQINKCNRQVTRNSSPKTQAVWSLADLYEYFCKYAYNIYDQSLHSTLGQSPREAFAAGLAQNGNRPQQQVVNDLTFQILTLPSTSKGTAKVHAGRGICINYLNYWSVDDCFLKPDVEGTQVPVRYDSFDVSTAYAYISGHWVRCISEYHQSFQGSSEREIKLTSTELRKQKQQHTLNIPLRAKTIAAYLESAEVSEALQLQRLRDLAALTVHQHIQAIPNFQASLNSNIASDNQTKSHFDTSTPVPSQDRKTIVKIDLATVRPYNTEELWK